MDALSPWHLALLLAIVPLVLGPGKLPETGAAIGCAMSEFRNAVEGKQPPSPDGNGTRRYRRPSPPCASSAGVASSP